MAVLGGSAVSYERGTPVGMPYRMVRIRHVLVTTQWVRILGLLLFPWVLMHDRSVHRQLANRHEDQLSTGTWTRVAFEVSFETRYVADNF